LGLHFWLVYLAMEEKVAMLKLRGGLSVGLGLGVLAMLLARAGVAQDAADAVQGDPPSRVARVSVVSGNVSLQPASVEQFNVAEPNYPMTTGDRIYADAGATAEIQTGQLAVRLGQQTDLIVTAMTDDLAQFGLAEGEVHLRSFNVYQGETVELDTPNVAVTVLQAGDVRVDVGHGNDVTIVTVLSGQVQVNGNGYEQVMEPGERLRITGADPLQAEFVGAANPDGLDQFSAERDGLYLNAFAREGQYINPGTIGGEDLAGYGTWEDDPDDGAVWYPARVAYDWQPYRNGHWTWVAPWGWTWIEAEPWGFAPFHYGRWERRGPRWGWVPGPPVVRPVYAPALVVFVGGGGFSGGVTAWFPLGPREVYTPWYHTSERYVNRVNVSNIYDRNVVQVRNIYNQRTVVNNYAGGPERVYVNRGVATVAMQQDSFARGGRADQSQLRVDARQLEQAPVLPHPLVTPERQMVAPVPARALPSLASRPVLASQQDKRVGPGSFQRWQAQQPSQPQPVVQPPVVQRQQPSSVPTVRQYAQPQSQPTEPQPERVQSPTPQPQSQPQRPLFNQAVPPQPRPSFEQQQRAIESTDPGRPLSTEQMQNLRQNQPVQPAQQREAAHPAAAPAPAAKPAPVGRPAPPPPAVVKH